MAHAVSNGSNGHGAHGANGVNGNSNGHQADVPTYSLGDLRAPLDGGLPTQPAPRDEVLSDAMACCAVL